MTAPQRAKDETCLISPALRGSFSDGAEQPRDERAAADAEHAADRHDEAEQRGAEGDRGEQRGVVQRADEAGVDDVVDGADDHRGGHRHAEVHEGAHDRRGGEVPAVGADGVGGGAVFEWGGAHDCSFPGRVRALAHADGRRRGEREWDARRGACRWPTHRVGCGSCRRDLESAGRAGCRARRR